MKSLLRLLNIEEAIRLKFGPFKKDDPDFLFEQLKDHCVCGAEIVCVCQRSDDLVHEKVVAKHFCLNKDCHHSQEGSRERVKSVKRRHLIDQCPICFRNL